MTFNTKLNIEDTVWYNSHEGCIKATSITGVTITHKRDQYYQKYQSVVVYESSDNFNFAEENEGKTWWSTRKGIVEYLARFDEFFWDSPPKQPLPKEKFKIAIPPDLYRRMSKISESLGKKKRCDCGVHRISEIRRRAKASSENLLKAMKPLPGIREKTLTDYADEL